MNHYDNPGGSGLSPTEEVDQDGYWDRRRDGPVPTGTFMRGLLRVIVVVAVFGTLMYVLKAAANGASTGLELDAVFHSHVLLWTTACVFGVVVFTFLIVRLLRYAKRAISGEDDRPEFWQEDL